MEPMTKKFECQVSKVDKGLGLVFGYAVICTENGKRYFDLQHEHIPESVMMDFSADFMRNSRTAKAMHGGDAIGNVVFAFPLTAEVAKALNITTKQTGLLVGMSPNQENLAKFDSGEFTGFSIGGFASYVEDGEDAEDEAMAEDSSTEDSDSEAK